LDEWGAKEGYRLGRGPNERQASEGKGSRIRDQKTGTGCGLRKNLLLLSDNGLPAISEGRRGKGIQFQGFRTIVGGKTFRLQANREGKI